MRSKCLRYSAFSSLASIAVLLFLPALAASSLAQTPGPTSAPSANLAVTVPSRLTQPIDETRRVTLQGTTHRLASVANDRGAASDDTPLERIHVALKRSDAQEAALKQAIADMHTPGTAAYHKWLTPEQFGQQFGPSDADIQTLTGWLGAHGFTVTKVNPGKQTLEISGTAGQFRDTFHAQIHAYLVNGQTHYANATDPQIPAAVAPVFGGFASLNSFRVKNTLKFLGKAQLDSTTHKVTPAWTEGTNGVNFILAPGDFAKQYDLTPLYNAGTNGTGQTIAIVNDANVSLTLVNQYRSLFGLSNNPPTVVVDGNDPGIDGINNPDGPNYDSIEAYLDVEQAGAVAPAATVDLVIAADTALESGLFLAAEHAIYSNVAPILSLSFGECEAGLPTGENAFINMLWEQAAAQGQTVLVSSGDNGSAGCDDDNTQQYAVYGQAVNGFGSTPWNVSVGGTDFYYSTYNSTVSGAQNVQLATYWNVNPSNLTPTVSLLQVVPEQPWNDSQFGLNLFNQYANGYGTSIAGGSGGASNCATGSPGSGTGGSGGTCAGYAKPAWQTALTPADKVRDLPDVSLFAANGNNYSFYPICADDGDCQPATSGEVQVSGVGGTSASTPAFAGILALVNQKYGRQGQADFVLYPLAAQYPAAFHDVVNGTNSVPCATSTVHYGGSSYPPVDCIAVASPITVTDPTYGASAEGQIGTGSTPEYNAVTGYDLATGLGSVDANVLVTNWNNVKFASTTVTLSPSQTAFPHGTSITVSGAVTPSTATGNVALMTTSTEPLNAGESTFALSSGQYSANNVNYLPGGTYTIYGMYSGDGTNGPSTSSKTSITVTPEASATSLTPTNTTGKVAFSNGATLAYGTQILLEAIPGSVNAANTTTGPTGSVTFLNGTATLATVPLNVEGFAEFNYAPPPSATPYSITAQYSGDNSYNASTSAAVTFTIAQDTPALSLGSSTQTGSAITALSGRSALTVAVENYANYAQLAKTGEAFANSAVAPSGTATLTGLPAGPLYFQLQPSIDPNTLFPEGAATVPLPTETPGTFTVTLSYSGDTNYAATSGTFSVTIASSSLIPTTTTASLSTSSTSVTATPNLTATVTGTIAGGYPSGTLEVFAAGVELFYFNLTSGSGDSVTATASLNGYLPTGANQLIVEYSGNSVYAPSYAIVSIVNGGNPFFTLGVPSAAISLAPGGSTTQTVTVTPANGFTGSVALGCAITGGTANPPTCSLPSPLTFSSSSTTAASATLTINTLTATPGGNYGVVVTAINGTTTQSATIPLTVTGANGTPAITLTNSGAITISTPGGSGTSTITVAPSGGFTGSVVLGCTVAPTNETDTPTCSVTSPISISSTASQTATLTVYTTAASASLAIPGTGGMPLLPVGGTVAMAALLFLAPIRRRRWASLLGAALALTLALGFSIGCGGSATATATGGGSGNPGTTTGAYTVTVTGSGTGVTSQTTTVSVTLN